MIIKALLHKNLQTMQYNCKLQVRLIYLGDGDA